MPRQNTPPQIQINLIIALLSKSKFQKALDATDLLIHNYPNNPLLYNLCGRCYAGLKQLHAATKSYEQAIKINPNFAKAHYNLGITLINLGHLTKAIASYKRALKIKPNYALAHNNLGIALKKNGQHNLAINSFKQALMIKSDYAKAHFHLGNTYAELKQRDVAIKFYEQALKIKPNFAEAQARKQFHQSRTCDWRFWADFKKSARDTASLENKFSTPFSMLAMEDAPEQHKKRAEYFATPKHIQTAFSLPNKPKTKPSRLRIGYFSADFHNHATMRLMAKLFKVHNRKKFEIFAYSYGPDKNDSMRHLLANDVDYFRDIKEKSNKEITEVARQDHIDIAIDLKGYTQHTRTGVFAHRLAPIQMNYLGYPGTLGADYFDYIIADTVVIPEKQRQNYTENIIYLPHSYQVNDDTRAISERPMSRLEFGLPQKAFVFCCFNNNYKISPQEFDIWMRLLNKVDGSVLWLLRSNKWTEINLRKEAKKRGINSERLIFANKLSQSEHLARQRLANLFLDTFNVNAHTTASDALWAGLPVVTKQGHGFAARVAASLLTAVGLPELITDTEEDYEALALDLATHKLKLNALKQKLIKNRQTYPLFNTELFARHLENAYEQAYELYFENTPPKMITVNTKASP